MSASSFGLLVLASFFVFIGWRRSFIDDTSSSIKEVAASIFTVVGSGEYIYVIILFLAFGFIAPTFLLGLAISFFWLKKYVPNIRQSINRFVTIDGFRISSTPDYFKSKFGKIPASISSVITTIAFLVIMWSQFALGGVLIEASTDLEYWQAVILISVTSAAYLAFGGLKALLHTDLWQGLLMWIGLLTVVIFTIFINPAEHLSDSFSYLTSTSIKSFKSIYLDPTLITVLIATIAAAFAGPDIWQRVSLSKDEKSAEESLKYAAIAMLLFIIPLGLWAIDIHGTLGPSVLSDVNNGTKEPIEEYLKIVSTSWPAIIMSIFSLGLLSAWLSTADTAGMVVSSTIMSELGLTEKKITFTTSSRLIAVCFICIGCIFAIFRKDNITDDFQGVIALLSAQGLPIFLSFLGYGTTRTVTIALILGILSALTLGYIVPEYNEGYWLLLPILPGLLLLTKSRIDDVELYQNSDE